MFKKGRMKGRRVGSGVEEKFFAPDGAIATCVAYDAAFDSDQSFLASGAIATCVAYDADFSQDLTFVSTGAVASAVAYDADFGGEQAAYGDTTFPQDTQPKIDAYHWMRTTLVESDYDYGHEGEDLVDWDKHYTDNDELAKLFFFHVNRSMNRLDMEGERSKDQFWFPFAESKHYMARYGVGEDEGWEGYGLNGAGVLGKWYMPNEDDIGDPDGHQFGLGPVCTRWAVADIRNTGDVQINPFYGESAWKYRGAVLMLTYGILFVDSGENDTRAVGGHLINMAITYEQCKDILPAKVKVAVKEVMTALLDLARTNGSNHVNGNMSMKAVDGAGRCAAISDWSGDSVFQTKCYEAAKMQMWAKIDGSFTNYNAVNGAGAVAGFHPAGYVSEGKPGPGFSPDVKYLGRVHNHFCNARFANHSNADWDFLDEPIEAIAKYRDIHMTPYDIAGTTNMRGGDADSSRLGGAAIGGFDTERHSQIYAGAHYDFSRTGDTYRYASTSDVEDAIALNTNFMLSKTNVDVNDDYYQKQTGDVEGVDYWNERIPNQYVGVIPQFSGTAGFAWPEENSSIFETADAAMIAAVIAAGAATTTHRLLNDPAATAYGTITFPSSAPYNYSHRDPGGLGGATAGADWYSMYELIAHRPVGGDWNCLLEGSVWGGNSYQSGMILHFYHEDQGLVVWSTREVSNKDFGSSLVDRWRVFGVWGRDDQTAEGYKFGWAKMKGRTDQVRDDCREIDWDPVAGKYSIRTKWRPPSGSPQPAAREDENVIEGDVDLLIEHELLTNGILTTATIEVISGSDSLREHWMRYPIFAGAGITSQTDEALTGSGWTVDAGVTVGGGVAAWTGAEATAEISRNFDIRAARVYLLVTTVTGRTVGTLTPIIGGTSGTAITSNGTTQEIVTATNGDAPEIRYEGTGSFDGNVTEAYVILSSPTHTVDYWTGSAWATLDTTLRNASKVRVGHDYTGGGYTYSYYTVYDTDGVTPLAVDVQYTWDAAGRMIGSGSGEDGQWTGLLDFSMHSETPGTIGLMADGTTIKVALETVEP